MPCYKPNSVWQPTAGGQVIWTEPAYWEDYKPITIPCGQCIGCRLERSRQWAMRCVHETQMHDDNSYITLTYDNKNLPANGSLVKKDFQLFMKRLRKKFKNKTIRFYMCGEYGDDSFRPHFHSILFNHDFDDKQWYKTIKGNKLYTSKTLTKIWGKGAEHCQLIGDASFESAAYVARYLMKKQTGNNLKLINPKTGLKPYELVNSYGEILKEKLLPEYTTMSLRPGIAYPWIDQYWKDVYPSDNIHMRDGKPMKPAKFYDNYLKKEHADLFDEIKEDRILELHKHLHDNTPERLATKEIVKQAQLNKLIRPSI